MSTHVLSSHSMNTLKLYPIRYPLVRCSVVALICAILCGDDKTIETTDKSTGREGRKQLSADKNA